MVYIVRGDGMLLTFRLHLKRRCSCWQSESARIKVDATEKDVPHRKWRVTCVKLACHMPLSRKTGKENESHVVKRVTFNFKH